MSLTFLSVLSTLHFVDQLNIISEKEETPTHRSIKTNT